MDQLELAEVLKAYQNVVAVEDDQVAGIASSNPGSLLSFPELENRILHIRSFSKSIAPDLRMAAAVVREPLREPLVEAKSFADGWSSRLLQRVLTKTLQAEGILEALNGARDAYRDRRLNACRAMSRILSARGGCWAGSDGVNVWVELPAGVDSKDVQEQCATEGVRIADGEPFFVDLGTNNAIRLNAGSVSTENAARAGQILSQGVLESGGRKLGPIHV